MNPSSLADALPNIQWIGDAALSIAILAGVAAIFQWIVPRIDAIAKLLPDIHEIHKQGAQHIASLASSLSNQATSWAVLAKTVSSLHYTMLAGNKKNVLLIEDSIMDTKLITEILTPTISAHRMKLMNVATLEESWSYIPTARVVILDISLPDCNLEKAATMIQVCPCPVVVLSNTEYKHDELPGCYAILQKNRPADHITSIIDEAIRSTGM